MKKALLFVFFLFTIAFSGRYYDADVGIFISVDPVGEFFNAYSYVGGNPISFIDPLGLSTFKIIRGDPDIGGEHEMDYQGATDAWKTWIESQDYFNPDVDGVVILDAFDVDAFNDAVTNHNDFGDIGAMVYIGHSSDGKLHVNMQPGTADILRSDISALSPKFAPNAWVGLSSCNSASIAKYISQSWRVPSFGNATSTIGISREGFPVGSKVELYGNGSLLQTKNYNSSDVRFRY